MPPGPPDERNAEEQQRQLLLQRERARDPWKKDEGDGGERDEKASLRRACRAARASFGSCYCAAFPGAAFARSVTTAASFWTLAWSLEVVAS